MDPRLHAVLVERYHEHFIRVNQTFDQSQVRWQARYAAANIGPVLETLPAGGARVLDLGCGVGLTLAWLATVPGVEPVGLDASQSQLDVAARFAPGVALHSGDALEFLRQHPNHFGAIICTDVLEHLPDGLLFDVVQAAHAALVPGGVFWVRVPNAACLIGTYSRYMDLTHLRSFTATSLAQLLEAGGFTVDIPVEREVGWKAKVRRVLQNILHRVVYRICGSPRERTFTRNVIAVARR